MILNTMSATEKKVKLDADEEEEALRQIFGEEKDPVLIAEEKSGIKSHVVYNRSDVIMDLRVEGLGEFGPAIDRGGPIIPGGLVELPGRILIEGPLNILKRFIHEDYIWIRHNTKTPGEFEAEMFKYMMKVASCHQTDRNKCEASRLRMRSMIRSWFNDEEDSTPFLHPPFLDKMWNPGGHVYSHIQALVGDTKYPPPLDLAAIETKLKTAETNEEIHVFLKEFDDQINPMIARYWLSEQQNSWTTILIVLSTLFPQWKSKFELWFKYFPGKGLNCVVPRTKEYWIDGGVFCDKCLEAPIKSGFHIDGTREDYCDKCFDPDKFKDKTCIRFEKNLNT